MTTPSPDLEEILENYDKACEDAWFRFEDFLGQMEGK